MKKIKEIFAFKRKDKELEALCQPCTMTKEQIQNALQSQMIEEKDPPLQYPDASIKISRHRSVYVPVTYADVERQRNALRYVWCDGFESPVWQQRRCRCLGIRLADSFILHETVVQDTIAEFLGYWCTKCHSRILKKDEFLLLNSVWNEVSAMRVKAGDLPLPDKVVYWVFNQNGEDETQKYCCLARKKREVFQENQSSACLLTAVF